MIHVQIACHVTDDGLEGVRWVLVEPGDVDEPAAGMSMAPDGAAPALAEPPRRLGFWRATVMGSGLVLALALGGWGLGLPGVADKPPGRPAGPVPAAQPEAVPGLASGEAVPTTQGSGGAGNPPPPGALPQPDVPPVADPRTSPEAPPARQDSPASAAQPERLITAGLR